MPNPIIIQTRIDLFRLLPNKAAGCEIAEVGVWRGYFSIEILNRYPHLKKLWLVDAWVKQTNYVDPISNDDHEANLRECRHHLRGHPEFDRWEIVRGFSAMVAKEDTKIPPLSAVYIDADHSYAACLADLLAWEKRLKPDGVLAGHDFTENAQAKKWGFGVVQAVHDFCSAQGWEIAALTNDDFASYMLKRK